MPRVEDRIFTCFSVIIFVVFSPTLLLPTCFDDLIIKIVIFVSYSISKNANPFSLSLSLSIYLYICLFKDIVLFYGANQ